MRSALWQPPYRNLVMKSSSEGLTIRPTSLSGQTSRSVEFGSGWFHKEMGE